MEVFETQQTVVKDDLDQLNHVNNIRYVKWVQDIAAQHWQTRATQDILDSYYWVMLSHHIKYKGEAVLGDELLLKTFITKSEGVKSIRQVEIYNVKSGKLITTSETEWCLISKHNNRPARITTELNKLFVKKELK